jgi:hypothetical protein
LPCLVNAQIRAVWLGSKIMVTKFEYIEHWYQNLKLEMDCSVLWLFTLKFWFTINYI